ncbi:MAG TPA: hypothetical protein GXX16_09190 [Epulopiscium sp.]|nr:hypothetical protein [Candidatus Epulonipiscium sp.]
MEEIIGLGLFLTKNKDFLERTYPWAIDPYKDFSTEGFSLAVFEELIICILISFIMKVTGNIIVSYIWVGAFFAFSNI